MYGMFWGATMMLKRYTNLSNSELSPNNWKTELTNDDDLRRIEKAQADFIREIILRQQYTYVKNFNVFQNAAIQNAILPYI